MLRVAVYTKKLSTICSKVFLTDCFAKDGAYKYVGVGHRVYGQDLGYSVCHFIPSSHAIY